ncbi:MAG: hypothetical protein A3G84_06935 [Chloroflexi bacterium RIFCSPLOWO2_12_FULL_71_12]|nr:MAG: hypothetical protein A3G84_06935 [Chloroflexi bacterium RIFCSPLOWO2_12_FULL_71_12]
MTKLDMLGDYERIPFCTAYEIDGRVTTDMPPTAMLERATPRYEHLEGWGCAITAVTDRALLPLQAKAYLRRIEETVGAPVGMVGIGPERTATLL